MSTKQTQDPADEQTQAGAANEQADQDAQSPEQRAENADQTAERAKAGQDIDPDAAVGADTSFHTGSDGKVSPGGIGASGHASGGEPGVPDLGDGKTL